MEPHHIKPLWQHFIEEIFWKSWWVALFSILCFLYYEQSQRQRISQYEELNQRFLELKLSYENAKALKTKLKQEINSQSDPAWVELILKRELGVIAEGETKFYFRDGP